ncbi:MAG: 16S rRNA (adenine(1518)-N(6)/adenine(1519)-N(6))-dimethyltransferase RsmA [Sterolibacteriaceae bacterium]|nr:16S rRNA (adenine(1518)-N(6)/adenine(1519)-N(6))-dimethyltransferase RsmA [Candidatus Methylophosphatis haderslevensis]
MSVPHRARKRFGQNFLVDGNIIRKIVAAIAPRPGDNLVEIGPGLGALTRPVLEASGHLRVVEIDRDLIARLGDEFAGQALEIHQGDALKFDFGALGGDLRVIGNLPYNISTPILFHLSEYAERIRDMTFMLQKEVVERMVAEPGGADYGRLSVMLQYRFRVDKQFDVAPGAFRPVPKVTSAIVRLTPRPAQELGARDAALLARIVSAAFGQRRKTLRNTLRDFADQAGLAELGIDPGLRGERLSVDDFVRIANRCADAGMRAS